jgi:probable LLM family oxidoreductase
MSIEAKDLKFGLDTFGDISVDQNGNPETHGQVLRNVVAQAVHADQLGLYAFNVGEHHRDDFAISAPDTLLAGIATVTKQIKLGTGVTVLSSDDPVRVYERFATLAAISNGRAEITAGRGSFTESFPLFGYDLSAYHILFEEKLELLVQLLTEKPVTWQGKTRASLTNQEVFPKTESGIGLRVGVGGSPESVIRAARLNLPLALAIIGGDPARFAPFAKLYRDALDKLERPHLPISIHSHGYVAATDEQAVEDLWPHYEKYMTRLGAERGWPPMSMARFMSEVEYGSAYVGSPETVAAKIVHALESVGAERFDFKYANGSVPHGKLLDSIELYATKVVPLVRDMMS